MLPSVPFPVHPIRKQRQRLIKRPIEGRIVHSVQLYIQQQPPIVFCLPSSSNSKTAQKRDLNKKRNSIQNPAPSFVRSFVHPFVHLFPSIPIQSGVCVLPCVSPGPEPNSNPKTSIQLLFIASHLIRNIIKRTRLLFHLLPRESLRFSYPHSPSCEPSS